MQLFRAKQTKLSTAASEDSATRVTATRSMAFCLYMPYVSGAPRACAHALLPVETRPPEIHGYVKPAAGLIGHRLEPSELRRMLANAPRVCKEDSGSDDDPWGSIIDVLLGKS